jgi:hypothetical protein
MKVKYLMDNLMEWEFYTIETELFLKDVLLMVQKMDLEF